MEKGNIILGIYFLLLLGGKLKTNQRDMTQQHQLNVYILH